MINIFTIINDLNRPKISIILPAKGANIEALTYINETIQDK